MSIIDDARKVCAVPLVRFLGARLAGSANGAPQVVLPLAEPTLNANGQVHGGTLYTLLDVAAYLALIPSFEPGQTAVTHAMSASLLRPARPGAEMDFEARVLRRGRSLVFLQVEARSENNLVAVATLTKSLIRRDTVRRLPSGAR